MILGYSTFCCLPNNLYNNKHIIYCTYNYICILIDTFVRKPRNREHGVLNKFLLLPRVVNTTILQHIYIYKILKTIMISCCPGLHIEQ